MGGMGRPGRRGAGRVAVAAWQRGAAWVGLGGDRGSGDRGGDRCRGGRCGGRGGGDRSGDRGGVAAWRGLGGVIRAIT